MIVTREDGRIIKGLDKAGVIAEYRKAQAEGDKFCSCIGWIAEGLDINEIEKEAGYTIGATAGDLILKIRRRRGKDV